MALQTYLHPFTYGSESPMAVDFHTYSVRRKLPKYRVCPDPFSPFYLLGSDAWNCAKCDQEKAFSLPVNQDDTFEFEFQFEDGVNVDPATPVFGWRESSSTDNEYYIGARVLDCSCNPVEDFGFIDQFCEDWGVKYDAVGGSFQWMKVDIGLLPTELCCFNLQVVKYVLVDGVATEDILITAGPFIRADSADCAPIQDTVLICGRWKKADCWGRRFDIEFGLSESTFTDCVRLYGHIVYLGATPEAVFDSDVEVKNSIRQKYRLTLHGVPPLIAKWIAAIIASNSYLSIGGYEIDRSRGDTVSAFERNDTTTQLFYGTIDFSTLCEVENFGCL